MDSEMHSISISTEEGKSGDDKNHMPKTLTEQLVLGLEDFFSLEVWRASVAELIGTAALVFALDTIVISSFETNTKTPNVLISIFIFISVSILILATFPISGGHLNPAITFSAALLGVISFARATIYILAQCLGAVLGALALQAVVSNSTVQAYSLGVVTVTQPGTNGPTTVGINTSQAFWLETFCMFVVLFASVWIAFDGRQAKPLGPVVVSSTIGLIVGLMVFVSTTVTGTAKGAYAGAGMNPARCLGPALVRGGHLWDGHWVFWLGPTIACLAFYMYIQIIPRQHFHPSKQRHDD